MKLPRVTSFFLFVMLFMISNSCKRDEIQQQKKSAKVLSLENKAYDKSEEKDYEGAVFYSQKMLYYAKKENSTSSIKDAYSRLSYDHQLDKTYDSAIYYSEKLYELGEKTSDTLSMAKARYKKGFCFKVMDSLKLAYKNFIDSKKLFLEIGDTIEVAKKLIDIATLEKKTGSFGVSQLSGIEGLRYVENTKQIRIASKLFYTIAVAAKEQGDLVTAEKRINQALDLAKDTIAIKKIGLGSVINLHDTKANILKEKSNYDVASNIYESLLNNRLNLGRLSQNTRARINGNLAHTLFLKEGYNKRSDSLLKRSLATYKKNKNVSGLISINMKLAEIYSKRDQQKALTYIDQVIDQAKKYDNKKSLYEAYQLKMNLVRSEENISAYLALEKKVEREEDLIQSQFANAKFDLEDAEKEKNEAERKRLISDEKAAKRLTVLLGLLLLLIILLVSIFFIYQYIKRRHQIEKLKTVHVTEARISSKVHDELANDLYELMTQLETASPEKEIVLDKLDTIYNQARDISKQIQTVDAGQGFADELSNLFRSYQSDKVNVLLKRYDLDIWKGISSHIKVTVYRVLQELLTNMKKHSNAGLVVVSIEKQNKQLFIQYIDNGKGFTKEISKNGLHNAENRIRAIKGKLTFDTELHKGCKFSINVPV